MWDELCVTNPLEALKYYGSLLDIAVPKQARVSTIEDQTLTISINIKNYKELAQESKVINADYTPINSA
jgi:hypothetical protein